MTARMLPTMQCFDDAVDYVMAMRQLRRQMTGQVMDESSRELLIVHALIPVTDPLPVPGAPKLGSLYAHGWVEEDQTHVVQAGLLGGQRLYFKETIHEFYSKRPGADVTKYTLAEFRALNHLHNHFGPFEERYRVLCGSGEEFEAVRADVQSRKSADPSALASLVEAFRIAR
jgi:hypothetical protein